MNSDDQAREIQERMARLRREIAVDVEQVSQRARDMTDWTFYVRRFPWATAALAAAAGFLLVPRKKQVVAPTAEQLATLVKNKEFVSAATSQLTPPPSMFKGLAATLAAMAARAAVAYIGQHLRSGAAARSRESAEPTASSHHESTTD